jgi:hypothetical protein
MTTPNAQFDRSLEQITTHLRAHVAELRRIEQTADATPSELEQRRELVARLQGHLAGLVRTALAPPEPAEPTSNDGPSPQRHAPHSRSRSRTSAGRIRHQTQPPTLARATARLASVSRKEPQTPSDRRLRSGSALDGRIVLESPPGGGTRVFAPVPIPDPG